MSIRIMPPLLGNILSNPIIRLCNLQQPHIHIDDLDTFLISHLTNGAHNGHRHAGQAEEFISRPSGVDEDDATGVFVAAGCEG